MVVLLLHQKRLQFQLNLTVSAAAVDASCSGVCDGDVTSLGAGGTAPITYSWRWY